MDSNVLFDLIGWVGVSTVLVAYALVSLRKLEGDASVYQLMNIAGAGFLLVNSLYHGAMPPSAANAAWVGIGIFTLARRRIRARRAR
jgi:hypothetical protein